MDEILSRDNISLNTQLKRRHEDFAEYKPKVFKRLNRLTDEPLIGETLESNPAS